MAQLISIQERGEIEGGWQAGVRFNNGRADQHDQC
jgi:hypothetical protein